MRLSKWRAKNIQSLQELLVEEGRVFELITNIF